MATLKPSPKAKSSSKSGNKGKPNTEKKAKKVVRKDPVDEQEDDEDEWEDEEPTGLVAWVKQNRLAFLVYAFSTAFHALILLVCAFYMLPQEYKDDLLALVSEQKPLDEEEADLEPMEEPQEIVEAEETDADVDNVDTEVIADTPSPFNLDIDNNPPSIPVAVTTIGGPSIPASDIAGGRSVKARAAAVAKYGGSAASEKAVSTGLKWLSTVQRPDGSWSWTDIGKNKNPGSFEGGETGATGIALLCYFGAGHTHERGSHKETVEKGLLYLMKSINVTPDGGDLRNNVNMHGMYIHAIANLALCEANAMTKKGEKYKKQLMQAATYATGFLINAQDPKGGGWRYKPRQAGDTSVVGWCLQALLSAKVGGIPVPARIYQGADYFLNSVTKDGATYGYTGPNGTPSMTAVGLLCRMYRGWGPSHEGLKNGVAYLDKKGPSTNMYYNYYATQVMHHWGGPEWTKWNAKMRERLVKTQIQTKDVPERGSWTPGGGHGHGGRLLETAFSILTLEVYYRHLPLYKRKNVQKEVDGL